MDFGANKTPAEVNKEGAFGDSSLRDIHSSVNEKCMERIWLVEEYWWEVLFFRLIQC